MKKAKESRFQVHDELTAPERSLPVLKGALSGGGQLPNIVGVLAGSPATLRAYPRFRSELRHGSLPWATQQRIALAVAEQQRSDYALSTLQRTAREAGLGLDEIALDRGDPAGADGRAAAFLADQAARPRSIGPAALGASQGARGRGDRPAARD